MTPEIEVLGQVADGSLPLSVVADLFADLDHCKRALGAMIEDGQVRLRDPDGNAIPSWRYREIKSVKYHWSEGSELRLEIRQRGLDMLR